MARLKKHPAFLKFLGQSRPEEANQLRALLIRVVAVANCQPNFVPIQDETTPINEGFPDRAVIAASRTSRDRKQPLRQTAPELTDKR
jgi:hypothetical protein